MTRSLDALPNAPLSGGGTVTALFSEAGIEDFHGAARHLLGLPYGRTWDRSKPALVLTEGRGTCSSKHALLAELAHELGLDVRLTLGTRQAAKQAKAICAENGGAYLPGGICEIDGQ